MNMQVKYTWHMIDLEIICPDIPAFLSASTAAGMNLQIIRQTDPLTITIRIPKYQEKTFCTVAERLGASVKVIRGWGIRLFMLSLAKRPVLIAGVLLLLFLTLWVPGKVFFFSVEGNRTLSEKQILEAAELCGICFGANRKNVRSEKMKNALLSTLPQLQWAGINTKGCTAVISVKEREAEGKEESKYSVSSLVAGIDGIIESGTALSGTLLCQKGQAVTKGDVLISGYTDCGITLRVQRARGEVYAFTHRQITVASPLNCLQKVQLIEHKKNYSIILGKKRINLLKCSGISGTSCDKMYKEYFMTLPGGFQLPFGIAVEITFLWQYTPTVFQHVDTQARKLAQDYLIQQMVSGEILDCAYSDASVEDVYRLHGSFLCREMIAREQNEEIIQDYGKNRGENR